LISFRVGAEDAGFLARELQPKFEVEDLVNLPNRNIYLKLMIDGTISPPFSAGAINSIDLHAAPDHKRCASPGGTGGPSVGEISATSM
jgi:hypothetical protein